MQKQLIECVPNFSEGINMDIIKKITDEIDKVEGVKLLDVDPGKATNRTVVTIVGEPEAVIEAAFQALFQQINLMSGNPGNWAGNENEWKIQEIGCEMKMSGKSRKLGGK